MNIKTIDQQYIYWRYKSQWCVAKVQVSASADKVFLYIWQLDGTFVCMTAGKQPETVLQSQGFKLWLREGSPNLKEILEEKVKTKPEQIEFF
ncbi:hypothetical protein Dred_1421 [Desulforamulus reducens MI-1]|uniref:Uncharacterized protein n=1 Tax=Desulforamulus reducens (strain ATCC BAA-1160 / DSM 100696 / MI-1) TaxID=349161 RepID=A4J4E8_DESRM|nr:hypothetical protein [Desulforamulus reducens]ABO49951.1 hypothetical protein Dred_1421 [Desulforamulus reducens MI-1]